REIWEQCGASRAILIVDLSGFTRLTKKHGILHFLTVYRRAVRLAEPILARGRSIKREADNLLYSFESAHDAYLAALELVHASAALDATVDHDARVLPCVGIGFGRILELADDVFGDEVNLAFKLGEDVAVAREILVTEGFVEQLAKEGVTLESDARDIELGGVPVRYFACAATKALIAS
ncbi:MAG: adenylate/guanylate cyclase domain-containing protein, partial [Polyangiales bacterium]